MLQQTPAYESPAFADALNSRRDPFRAAITRAVRIPEVEAVSALLGPATLLPSEDAAANGLALKLAQTLRNRKSESGRAGIVQGLLQEYSLSSQEGVALMCLAEALLRIPDAATRDALIRDKIANGDWRQHVGQSSSLFVNAATWGLLLTGRLVSTHSELGLSAMVGQLISKGGEPLIRKGVDMAMRMMGEQFVCGETIAKAVRHAKVQEAKGFRYSYDMLGEAALTSADAHRYLADYEKAIDTIGRASNGAGILNGPGISIKLSALHPRYSRAQYNRVMEELYPRVLMLAARAKKYDIGLNIDAEEADRLELSLDLLERLCFAPELAGWDGIGFVIQAYQKRCPFVIDFLADLARRSKHRLMIRLVKGAYWDSEIKRAQVDGQEGYPVYTRKPYTDVAYLACARKLLAEPDAFYPQFATHNAHTVAAIYEMAGPSEYRPGQYEFQCLHGMGEPLYEQVVGSTKEGGLARPCRIYAPVGTHETLLAYLVRRLLENGANTSFVNRIADPDIPLETLVENPLSTVERFAVEEGAIGLPHPAILSPAELFGESRKNSMGIDLSNELQLESLTLTMEHASKTQWVAEPLLAEGAPEAGFSTVGEKGFASSVVEIRNPADLKDLVGKVTEASSSDVEFALEASAAAVQDWASTSPKERADILDKAADALQADMELLISLLAREAGKTASNAVAEIREAIDFLRFYAHQVRADFSAETHRPLGPVVCISPWNFPLAIFVGQVCAALAAGNTVLAKPAEQTPLVAAHAVRCLWSAGVPRAAVQLLPGRGETVGAALVGDPRVQGVVFTGSTEVARILQRTLATRLSPNGKPIPLVAETGGQNAMVVDSSALAEQVVVDIMSSAFDSAGQRCSALRLLCLQDDIAERTIEMLKGAMAQARIGNPMELAVDIGPVIDTEARDGIERHISFMRERGREVHQSVWNDSEPHLAAGTFVVPTLIELESVEELTREVFGPVLHVVRYPRKDLKLLLKSINSTGYGLTFGLHTRIDETISTVTNDVHAGNVYVNRNMVGAVVGVQPFGGEGLSGTGPKAGGPLYLYRLLSQRPSDVFDGAAMGSPTFSVSAASADSPLSDFRAWAEANGHSSIAKLCDTFKKLSKTGCAWELRGPTGERNVYSIVPRPAVLCLAHTVDDRLIQLAAALSVGSRPVIPAAARQFVATLPESVQKSIEIVDHWGSSLASFDAVLHHGNEASLLALNKALADRDGAIIGVCSMSPGDSAVPLERLMNERALSVNTAAAGGNASLMTIA